jgi:Domain of unknown function (DUF4349)
MRVEELERELRAERIEPDPEFARRLDEWAAAGFPREREPGAIERLRRRFEAVPPRRVLLRAGAVATAVVVVGVSVSKLDLSTDGSDDAAQVASAPESRETGGDSGGSLEAVPTQPEAPGAAAAEEYELAPGIAEDASRATAESAAPAAPLESAAPATKPSQVGPAGRRIAQRVDLSLSTAPAEFRDAADGVLDVVADHRGFVVSSRVSGGDPDVRGAEPGRANFQLKIPARQLPAALAALSDLGHVVSRTDGTEDITGRFVGAKRRIAALIQARQNLLVQLEDAVLETEQQSIRARLRIVQAQLEDAQGDLAAARQRVSLVPVSVAISADPSVRNDRDEDDSGWSISDALRDAGDVLTVMAGIALVSLAVLVPLSLVGLLIWWGATRVQRHRREAVLD